VFVNEVFSEFCFGGFVVKGISLFGSGGGCLSSVKPSQGKRKQLELSLCPCVL